MSVRRNIMIVAALLALTLGGTALLADARAFAAVAYAGCAAALNAVAAHVLIVRTEGRPSSAFVKLVLGGMAVRMFAVLAAVVVGLAALDLPALPLVASLFGHFVLFLALEMTALRGLPGGLAAEHR